jgi:UDP-2,3-diacylglucosamine pyrophosphatase LpxH
LAAVLDYIIAHADVVDQPVTKLVILGDFFDFWTCPPSQRPPTICDIIDANERILGPDGKLRQAVEALRGNVIYLRGNHDQPQHYRAARCSLLPCGRGLRGRPGGFARQ